MLEFVECGFAFHVDYGDVGHHVGIGIIEAEEEIAIFVVAALEDIEPIEQSPAFGAFLLLRSQFCVLDDVSQCRFSQFGIVIYRDASER